MARHYSTKTFFAYPEDYSQRGIEWVRGELKPRPHTPAFEVIFVYSQTEGKLDINYTSRGHVLRLFRRLVFVDVTECFARVVNARSIVFF